MGLREIVDVQITRETRPVSQAGFSTVLIVGPNAPFAAPERIRFYTDPDEILDDGYDVADPEYVAANTAFSQEPAPERVAIGRKDVGETWAAALTAIRESSDDWYGLVVTTRTQADVEAVAEWVESRNKLFGTSSANVDIYNAGLATDIASVLKAADYARSFVIFHPTAATIFPEAAWMAQQLAEHPGSTTWMFKSLSGIAVTTLTSTQSTAARNKNANTYEQIGGVPIMREGKVAEGEFIDVIVGVDWMEARMTERIYARLVNAPKIPYTDAGVAVIEAEIRAQLDQGIAHNFISPDPPYTVTAPKVVDVPFNDRANRLLPDVEFRATLASAIHAVQVRGRVSV